MPRKRFLTKRGFADVANVGIGSVTKAIKNGWIELSEHPSFEGDFIDTSEYKPEKYFSYIAVCQKNRYKEKYKDSKINLQLDHKIIPHEKLIKEEFAEKGTGQEEGQKSA